MLVSNEITEVEKFEQLNWNKQGSDILILNSPTTHTLQVPNSTPKQKKSKTPFLSSSPPYSAEKPLLLLDLDGTLAMMSTKKKSSIRSPDFTFCMGTDKIFGWQRACLEEFLFWANQHFNVYIWTASFGGYAKKVIECITANSLLLQSLVTIYHPNDTQDGPLRLPVQGIFEKDECEAEWKGATLITKNLRQLMKRHFPLVNLENVVVIDNDFYTFRLNSSNAIPIGTFAGEDDFELHDIMTFLRDEYLPTRVNQSESNQPWYSQ